MKRFFLTALVCLAFLPSSSQAEEKVKIDDATKKSIDKALAWLKEHQDRDGKWGNPAITSFCLLAFMANGHVPNQGLYAPEVSKAVRQLLSEAQDNGYLAGRGAGNMYCHGMATLALTQVYGMTGDEEVKKVLKKAVDLILKSQNSEGGWRYDPTPTAADISVTIMQVMALRGAKDSGLHVPDSTIKNALKYIDKCHDARTGGYKYMPYSAGAGYARTAAGVCVLQLSGEYEAAQIDDAVKYLEREESDRTHFWYGHYYAAHAFHQLGGKKWEDYYTRMKDTLLSRQKSSGEWLERMEQQNGAAYQTAIAVLILSVPSDYLPIYQR
ncbi:prenyltransferase/squalene oxidase repeat-containing protein [Limnoglobus roseus]|uniref:Prenyltransferase n=1 Tax=Limnoglobus roseus TaxID=2598579 RepID=A0A5C1AM12_9BACT|nr:prenyltransferase/squalene oxidase repeat-containing protein [Limnoglobus roseus]QEL18214.1 prenyltransferase [Limnoglobus roseus]